MSREFLFELVEVAAARSKGFSEELVASLRVPSKPGLSSLKIFRAARFLETR